MAPPKIKDTELQALLQEMEADLQQAYEQEKEKLVKAEGDKPEETPGEAPPESSDAPASPSPEASDTPPSPPADAPPSAPPAESAPADPAADPAAEAAPLTPEALQAEYAQLAPEELDMHIKAALAAKEAMAAASAPAPSPSAPPSPPVAAPSPSPSASPAMKAELKVDKKAIGGKMAPVKKSESEETPAAGSPDSRDTEIAELKGLVKSQAEDIEILSKAVKMVMEQPLRKAVTSVAFVPKTEPEPKTYSREDAQRIIRDGAHKLSKSERELVLDVFDGRQPITRLEPVLEKLTASK